MLRTRVLVGVVALPILVAIVLAGSWAFAPLVTAVLLVGGYEYARLMRKGSLRPAEWLIAALILLPLAAIWFGHSEWREPGLALLLIAGMGQVIWDKEHNDPNAFPNMAWSVLGGVYLGWLGCTLIGIRRMDDGAFLVLALYGMVIVSDSAAFFVGRRWGKRKLSPQVSPKKSWEGYIGGIGGALVFGAITGLFRPDTLPVIHGAMIGLLIGILGTLGDLFESAIKRQVGAKDSSNLIPGHGGMLDRIDSVLVAATIGYYYLLWFVN